MENYVVFYLVILFIASAVIFKYPFRALAPHQTAYGVREVVMVACYIAIFKGFEQLLYPESVVQFLSLETGITLVISLVWLTIIFTLKKWLQREKPPRPT